MAISEEVRYSSTGNPRTFWKHEKTRFFRKKEFFRKKRIFLGPLSVPKLNPNYIGACSTTLYKRLKRFAWGTKV